MLVPVAAVAASYVASYVGLTTAGFAAGNPSFSSYESGPMLKYSIGSVAVSYESIVYSSAARVLLASLQSAGTTTIIPSIGTVLTGAATTGAGVLVATTGAQSAASNNSESLHQAVESLADDEKPEDGDNGDPPLYHATASEEHFITPRAVLAIVKSWEVQTYNPSQTDCTVWLSNIHDCCERYGIPTIQRASCAMHYMSGDCKEAALDAGCCNMTWDKFTVWLHQYDRR